MKSLLIGLILCCGQLAASPIADLKLIGEAKLEILFWDIYRSKLYSSDGQYSPSKRPVALEIEYLRDIKAKELVEATEEEWQKLGIDLGAYQSWLPQISQIWPDILEHDVLTLRIDQDGQSQFFFNHQPIGTITDTAFGPAFLAIWLDAKASYPKLRRQLIGQTP